MRRPKTYGPKVRTQAQKTQSACNSIYSTWPAMLAAMTAERLCELHGVTTREGRERVARELAAEQQKERARVTAEVLA